MKRERGLVFLVPEGRFSGGQEGDSWWDENKSHKSWNPLNKRIPRLFLLLCYYFATNSNYFANSAS